MKDKAQLRRKMLAMHTVCWTNQIQVQEGQKDLAITTNRNPSSHEGILNEKVELQLVNQRKGHVLQTVF